MILKILKYLIHSWRSRVSLHQQSNARFHHYKLIKPQVHQIHQIRVLTDQGLQLIFSSEDDPTPQDMIQGTQTNIWSPFIWSKFPKRIDSLKNGNWDSSDKISSGTQGQILTFWSTLSLMRYYSRKNGW